MAWSINALQPAIAAISTLYTLSGNDFGGSEIRIHGTGFTYDAVTGLLNGGTIASMDLVITNGPTPTTIQTVTMIGGLAASTYFAFAGASAALRAQIGTWALQFPNNDSGFTFSSTQITLVMLDGTKVVITGSGFNQATDAGTVTSMEHLAADNSVLHTATGFPQPLSVVSSAFGNDEAFYSALTQGDDVLTQVNGSYQIGLEGGTGNDIIVGAGDRLNYSNAASAVTVDLDSHTATGGAGSDSLSGTFGGVVGSAFDDVLTGGTGDDYFDGRQGNDTIDGGDGNDTASYRFLATQEGVTTGVTVNLSLAGPQNTGAQGVDTLINIENLVGSEFADTLTGNALANVLDGGAGDDTLNGGAGGDTMVGGDGDDTYYVDNAGDQVNEFNVAGGIDAVNVSLQSYSMGSNTEILTYTGNGPFTANGNFADNVIEVGNASSSFVQGNVGSDVITGGAGADQLYGDSFGGNAPANSGITLGSGTVVHSGAANGSLATALNISSEFSVAADPEIGGATLMPHVTISATGGGVVNYYAVQINNLGASIVADIDHGFGTSNDFQGAPVFTAIRFYDPNGNQNWFGTGSDTSSGAGGSDTYTDSYISMQPYMTGLWKIAVLTYTGNYPGGTESGVANGATYELNISVTGELQTFDDMLYGNGGDDMLVGGLGNDLLDGGDGTDTADYFDNLSSVTAILGATATGLDVGTDTLVSIENLNGSHAGDFLFGNSGGNSIHGNDGDDTIYAGDGHDEVAGGDGNDTLVGNDGGSVSFLQESDVLDGGAGNDTFFGETADTVSGGTGTDVLYAVNSNPWTINLGATSIEWMLAGFGNDDINAASQSEAVVVFASGGNDVVTGSAFADFLWAGAGDDTLSGGEGDDMLFGDMGADSLSAGGGNDVIFIDSDDTLYNGGTGIDIAYVTSGTGVSMNLAAAGLETLVDIAGGNDLFDGSTMTVQAIVFSGGGTDVLRGGSAVDYLWGEAGDDTLEGNGNGDILVGGAGSDTITGGAGNDNIFANSGAGGDSVNDVIVYSTTGWGTDFVYDFEHGIDKLDFQGSGLNAGLVTITNAGGSAYVQAGADLIVLVGQGGLIDTGDMLF